MSRIWGLAVARVFPRALALIFMASLTVGQQSPPDLILLNGKIFTSDSAHPYVQAVAIRGDRIVAVGTSEKISSLAGAQTKRIDLGGRLVIPGINDAHYHLFVDPPLQQLQFGTTDPTWEEVKEQLAAALTKTPKGMLIRADTGATLLEDPRVTRTALDELAPDHPVMLSIRTQHSAVLNTAALRLLSVKEDEPDPEGGRYVRSSDGMLTGLVLEFAGFRLRRRLSEMATDEQALQQVRQFFNEATRLGITSVQNMSIPVNPERCVRLFGEAPTPIRMRVIRFLLTDQHGRVSQEGRNIPARPSPLVTVSGTKWVLDGTAIDHSSATRQPYADRPDSSGEMNFSQKEMETMLRESLQNRDQLLVHVIGDRTTETFLNAMDATGGKKVWLGRRVRIEHGDGIMPDLLPRVKELGVVVVQNPTHLGLGPLSLKRFGPERAARLQPLRSLLEAGVPLAFGSDGPHSPNNPYLNIMRASSVPGKPNEAITREQAVIAYTLTAAYAEFTEKEKGSLEPGKFADLAVLSQDIFGVSPQDLPKTESVLTLVGGKIVYDARAAVSEVLLMRR